MSKIKFRFKMENVELEVEGERGDITAATRGISGQLAGLITPPGQIVNGGASPGPEFLDITPVDSGAAEQKPNRRRHPVTRGGNGKSAPAIDFVNEPARFGTPTQSWSLTDKAMWTLFVVSQLNGVTSLSAGVIGRTFNKHFRQAGQIRPSNVSRDLGRAKTKQGETPPLVGEDTTKAPSEWFLTDEGTRHVRRLISASIGGQQAAA